MRNIVVVLLSFGLLGDTPARPDAEGWGWKLATDIDDAHAFLNGTGAYSKRVRDARISAVRNGDHVQFYIWYRHTDDGATAPGWGWKLSNTPHDVMSFLNGDESYSTPVSEAQIAAVSQNNEPRFYVFYQRLGSESATPSWGWRLSQHPDDAMRFLNGTEPYRRPIKTARIAAFPQDGRDQTIIFYQSARFEGSIDNWRWKIATTTDDAYRYVNGQSPYRQELAGFEISMTWKDNHTTFYVYANKGDSVWMLTPLFGERFVEGETTAFSAVATHHAPSPETLSWSSSIEGDLGTGESITSNQLSSGSHTIAVQGRGTSTSRQIRIYDDLGAFYLAPPAGGEIARVVADFDIQWIDGAQLDEQWANYPVVFDQASTEPTELALYAKLDVMRHQRFAVPLPFSHTTVYEHFRNHVKLLRLRLDCRNNTGGGNAVSLNRNFSVWDGRSGGTPENPEACKAPFDLARPSPYVWPLYLLVHEGRHSDPGDPGHVTCNGRSNMDLAFENGSGHAWAALYSMWVYKYGMYDSPEVKQQAKAVARNLLERRFCTAPTHSDTRVQAIIDELLHSDRP